MIHLERAGAHSQLDLAFEQVLKVLSDELRVCAADILGLKEEYDYSARLNFNCRLHGEPDLVMTSLDDLFTGGRQLLDSSSEHSLCKATPEVTAFLAVLFHDQKASDGLCVGAVWTHFVRFIFIGAVITLQTFLPFSFEIGLRAQIILLNPFCP